MWSNLLVVRIHLLVNVARLLLVHTRHGHRVEELIKRQHVVAVLVDARKYALQSGHRFAPLHNGAVEFSPAGEYQLWLSDSQRVHAAGERITDNGSKKEIRSYVAQWGI